MLKYFGIEEYLLPISNTGLSLIDKTLFDIHFNINLTSEKKVAMEI